MTPKELIGILLAMCWCIVVILTTGDWHNYKTGREGWQPKAGMYMLYPVAAATCIYAAFVVGLGLQ